MKKLITLLLLLVSTCALAWPNKEITLIVPYPPGGVNDQLARIMQPDLESILRVPVQIKNMPGAANGVAINHVLGTANDDHTFIITMDDFVLGPLYQGNRSYTNFKATNIIGTVPYVLFGGQNSSAEHFKQQIKNKQIVNIGNNGINGGAHLWGEQLKSKVRVNPIFYKGSAPLITDVIAGHTEYGISSLTASYQFVQSGKLRPILQSGRTRSVTYPDVPTARESGIKVADAATWFGVFTRRDTSSTATNRMSTVVKLIVANNSKIQEFKTSGMNLNNLTQDLSDQFFVQQIQQFEQQKQ